MANNLRSIGVAFGALLVSTHNLPAFNIAGAWPNGDIPLVLQLDAAGNTEPIPSGGLSDGSANWNSPILPAITEWNSHMIRSTMTTETRGTSTATNGDNENSLLFGPDLFGEPFGSRTLAATLTRRAGLNGLRQVEADIVFNTAYDWDSYSGNLRSEQDIRRIALHEIGHLLGLLHPDEDTPPQSVSAIMNSSISNTFSLQQDDIDGISLLYNTPLTLPVITTQPQSRNVTVGQDATLSIELNGAPPPPPSELLQYAWTMDPPSASEEFLFTQPDGNIALGTAQLSDAGTYRVRVESPQGEVISNAATIAVSPVSINPSTRLGSISTRGFADVGDNALIVGFAIGGTETRRVLVRGIGPALVPPPFNVTGVLENPMLQLVRDGTVLASNDDWDASPNKAELEAAFAQSGAFVLPAGAGDSALIADLAPDSYTALVQRSSGSAGAALVEVYDLSTTSDEENRLISLSTRGFVGTDDNVLIAGISVLGSGPRTYILRAAGDSLSNLGVSNYLDDPVITLFSGSTRLRFVDDWDSPAFLQPTLQNAFTQAFAFQFIDRQESAMLVTLNPGTYTLIVSGFDNSTGIALVEAYEMR